MSPCHKFNKKKIIKQLWHCIFFVIFQKLFLFSKGFLADFVKSPQENACSIYTLAFFLFSFFPSPLSLPLDAQEHP